MVCSETFEILIFLEDITAQRGVPNVHFNGYDELTESDFSYNVMLIPTKGALLVNAPLSIAQF